jgi:hypothetical protein
VIDPDDDPGILGALRGAEIGEAERTMPPIGSATVDRMSVVFDSEFRGRVRVTCQRTTHRHGKAAWVSWVAVHAEPAPDAPLGVETPA